jgi:hypothetical protein
MKDELFTTPVLFLIFNRPDKTRKVFNKIRQVKPRQLFIAADGPRISIPGEAEKCQQTRKIIEEIDWDCELFTLFREQNLGCKKSVSSAINWFFDNVDEGVILEDDCVPDTSFFYFCKEMLNFHRHNEVVMHIGGSNFKFGRKFTNETYYLSRYSYIWGWATWRRAWVKYDINMKCYPKFKSQQKIKKIVRNKKIQKIWLDIFERVYDNKIDTWDYQWQFCIWNNDSYTILPNVNLISNIGFDGEGTHTIKDSIVANIKTQSINKIYHPLKLEYIPKIDEYDHKIFFPSFFNKVEFKIKKIIANVFD